MSITNIFHTVASDFVKAAKDFKSVVLKAANDAPAVVATIEANAPEVEALSNLLFPGASAIEQAGLTVLEHIASAVEAAGTAAAANGLSVDLDKTAIASVQAVLPSLKAAQAAVTK